MARLWVGLALAAAPVRAELWPLPASVPQTTVPCADCAAGQPSATVGYTLPLQTFAGRFLDSDGVSAWFAPFRTARATSVTLMPALDRVYFLYGSGTVAAYSLSAFFSRLEGGEPLVFPLPVPADRAGQPEKFLRWDAWFNPELNGWKTFNIDGDVRVAGFDVDDRGNVYVAATIFGWGIVKDPLSRTGASMPSLFQDTAHHIGRVVALKGSSRYYALGAGLWDTTDPAHPAQLGAAVPSPASFAKTPDAGTIAILDSYGKLTIATADGLAAGLAVYTSTGPGYRLVTTDGVNFFVLKTLPDFAANVIRNTLITLSPSGGTYRVAGETSIDALPQITSLRYGAGYLVMTGADAGGSWDLRVFKLDGLGAAPVSLAASPADPAYPSYFRSYYGFAPAGYAAPSYINMLDGLVYRPPSGAPYLIVCAKGLGDVYRLQEGPAELSAALSSPAGGAVLAGSAAVQAQACGDVSSVELYDGQTRLGPMSAPGAISP